MSLSNQQPRIIRTYLTKTNRISRIDKVILQNRQELLTISLALKSLAALGVKTSSSCQRFFSRTGSNFLCMTLNLKHKPKAQKHILGDRKWLVLAHFTYFQTKREDKKVYSIWERFWSHKKRLVGLEMRQVQL